MVNAVGIIQARMGSERLPGKILAPLVETAPLLEVLAARLDSSSIPWWLATTSNLSDDATAGVGKRLGMEVYRGDELDVLSRFAEIIKRTNADVVVRVTADNPFTHGAIINDLIDSLSHANDNISCVQVGKSERRFPLGFVPEAVRARDLLELERSIRDTQSIHRTHVTSGFRSCKVLSYDSPGLPARPEWRWTVDTILDMEMARASFRLFSDRWQEIGYADMVEILDRYPDIATMNAGVEQRSISDG